MTAATAAAAAPDVTGTNETAGARRIADAFGRARDDGRVALIPYIVAGYPDAETSFQAALAAADAGADLLEVGLPYSDPLADGATLQRASGVALAAGATLERSLALIERIGAARPELPLVPMGYANQVIGGGDGEAVARRLAGAGAAGLIVADLTPDEGAPFEAVARAAGLAVVYLVAPTTSPERRGWVASRTGGFLYCVSLVGVTGARTSLPSSVGTLVREVKAASPVPVAVGFGVSQPAHVRAIAKAGADGVIVASALVDAMGTDGRDVAGLAAPRRHPAGRDRWPLSVASRDATTRIDSTPRWRSSPSGRSSGPSTGRAGAARARRSSDALERLIARLGALQRRHRAGGSRAARRQRRTTCSSSTRSKVAPTTDFGAPERWTASDDRPTDCAGRRPARPPRGGRLVRARRRRRNGAGRVAQGSARRWAGPRQGLRARPHGRTRLRPEHGPEAAGAGCRRPGLGRCSSATRSPPSCANPRTDRRSRAASGTAGTPLAGSRGTSSITPGRSRTGPTRPDAVRVRSTARTRSRPSPRR